MKNNIYLLIGFAMLSLYSCDKNNDSNFIEVETTMKVDIPIVTVSSEGTKSVNNNLEIDYSFSGTNTYSSGELAGSNNEIFNVQEIKPTNASVLTFHGVNENNQINSLVLEWGYTSPTNGTYSIQESIDLLAYEYTVTDGIFKVNLNEAMANLINSISSNSDYTYSIQISGKSNFNLNSIAKLEVPVIVESETYNVRYELF